MKFLEWLNINIRSQETAPNKVFKFSLLNHDYKGSQPKPSKPKKEELKVGDIVEWKNKKWRVISIEDEIITLSRKGQIKKVGKDDLEIFTNLNNEPTNTNNY